MNIWFYVKCFLIGISASSAMGPIFILTFNRGALHGFLKGFATAMGSALADGLFFMLGLFAILERLENSPKALLALNCIGGIFLIILGMQALRKQQNNFAVVKPLNLGV